MVVDGGETMTQNEALLQSVANKYPEADLAFSGDIDKTYELQNVLAVVGGDLHPAFSPMFAPTKYTTDTDDVSIEKIKNAAYIKIDNQMTFIDSLLANKEYVVGNKKTIADAYLFTVLRWSFMTPKSALEYPNIKKYFEKMSQDESVIKLLAIHNPE
jgi:glutathione S-transferase